MDSKKVLEQANKEKKVIKRKDRIRLQVIVKDHRHYKLDQIIEPHTLLAEELIKSKIAKEIKE